MTMNYFNIRRSASQYLFNPILIITGTVFGVIFYPLFLTFNVRLLNVLISRIGHLCVEPDCFIKEGVLSLRQRFKGIILASEKHVANPHIINYWSNYFIIIRSSILCKLLAPLLYSKLVCYDVKKYCYAINTQAEYVNIQRQYIGRKPILSLTNYDRERGWRWLKEFGVPVNAWFVCLHCRQDGYVDGEYQSYRNADINSFVPAIEAITQRGGWVIIMGHVNSKKLPSMDRVIDYAHLNEKSDWIDIFLCAECKFFLGTSSGLSAVAHVFGVPVISTNAAPMSMVGGLGSYDLSIQKLVWSDMNQRRLSFREIFDSDIGNYRYDYLYSESGVKVLDNDSEDIKQVVFEMMDRIEGKCIYSLEDERLQNKFKSMMRPVHYSCGTITRVGRDFLRKYAFLLD
jgi:putative glycosyltransferase (TIGR04372 family)